MISIIIPVYNEEKAITKTFNNLVELSGQINDLELIFVNDGSTDNSFDIIKSFSYPHLKIINHPENLGYGKSIQDGIFMAKYDCIGIIDADNSYPIDKIPDLFKFYPEYDMIVGARTGMEYKKGLIKGPARFLFNYLVQYATGRKVPDVNSGLRLFKKSLVLKYKDSLCPGFSFTSTLTLIFYLNYYFVKYINIDYYKRDGKSKVNHIVDTLRSGQIIIQSILYHNPIKLFLLIANINLIIGLILLFINYCMLSSFLLLILSSLLISMYFPIFCIGLLADQMKVFTNLIRKNSNN